MYLGKDPLPSWDYAPLGPQGYANPALYEFWRMRDPIPTYARKLEGLGVIAAGDLDRMKRDAEALVDAEAQAVIAAPWPAPQSVTVGVFADDPVDRRRVELFDRDDRTRAVPPALTVEAAPPFDPKGTTLLEAVMLGIGDALAADARTFVFGEDVGGNYGNAFLLPGRSSNSTGTGFSIRRSPSGGRSSGPAWGSTGRPAPHRRDAISTILWRPASISWSTTRPRFGIAGAGPSRWSCACPGAGCGMPGRGSLAEYRASGSLPHAGPQDRRAVYPA